MPTGRPGGPPPPNTYAPAMNQTGRTSPAGSSGYMGPGQPPATQQQRMPQQHPGHPGPPPTQPGVKYIY